MGGRHVTTIIRKELKLLLKGKGNLFFLIVMPMLFIVLFGSAFSKVGTSDITVNYVDQDRSAGSQQFIHSMGQVKGFELKEISASSLSDQIQKIKSGQTTSLLVIPQGFGYNLSSGTLTNLKFYVDGSQSSVSGPVESLLNSIATQYQKQKVSAALTKAGQNPSQVARTLQPPVQVQEVPVTEQNGTVSMLDQVVPGYTVMFVFFIMMSMMRSFIGEKESGMLARILSTPARPLTYLFGMWIPALFAVVIQCVVLLGFGHFVYGVNLGDLSAIAVIVLCLGICGTGLGLAVSLLIRGENQGRGITMLLSLGGAAVGGLWLPSQLMPHFIQVLGHFTPQFWAQQAFQNVMVRGAHISDVTESLGVLLAFGVSGFLVALMRFQKYVQTATNG